MWCTIKAFMRCVQLSVVLNGWVYFDLSVDAYLKDKQCTKGIQSDHHEFEYAFVCLSVGKTVWVIDDSEESLKKRISLRSREIFFTMSIIDPFYWMVFHKWNMALSMFFHANIWIFHKIVSRQWETSCHSRLSLLKPIFRFLMQQSCVVI